MFWLLNKKGFSELLKGILVVVLIIFSLFAFKGPIIDGFNSVFKLVISEKGELKTDDSALEVLRGAYEHCKGEAGSECLCSGGVNLVLSKNELVTVWDSGGGVLIESNQEGSSTVDSVTFCVAEHKRIKDTCSFVYDADAIFNSEEISFSFLNSEWVYTSDTGVSINNKVYLFFNNILEQGSGLYQPTGIFDEENYVRVVDEASDLKLLTFKGVTSLVQNDLIFSGKLYYVSVITDSTTGFPRGECLDTFPYHCVTVNEVKFMFTLVDVPNFYFNYINLNYGNPYQRYNPNSDEFGVDIGEGYIYYDGTDFYGFNFATTDRQTLEQFINVVGGIKDTKKDTEPIVDPTYGADYVFNSDYDLENQKEVVQQAEKIGVPTQLALGLSLYESGRFEHIVKGEVLIGSDKHGYGLMQIDDRFHPGCFENPFFEDRGICDKADSCSSSDVKELSCNIGAGLTLLRDNYDKCLSIKGKTYQCHELNVRYYGWDCALRFYNGWGCNYPGVEEYVTRVKEKMKEFEPKVV